MNIPQELNEAALIDGATGWQLIRHIQLPLCRASIGTSVIASLTSRIAMYEQIALTTSGGPGDDTMSLPIILVKGIMDYRYGSGRSKTFTDAEKERLATEKNDRYRKLLAQMSPADMPTAVRDALTALHNAGLKLAVGSFSKNATYILERLDANRYFDAVCDGTMIAHSKPDPEVFAKAAAMVGLAPADCLVVEDAAAGLEAARAGGMDCAIVGTAPMPFEPTYHMQDVTKLPGTIL